MMYSLTALALCNACLLEVIFHCIHEIRPFYANIQISFDKHSSFSLATQ